MEGRAMDDGTMDKGGGTHKRKRGGIMEGRNGKGEAMEPTGGGGSLEARGAREGGRKKIFAEDMKERAEGAVEEGTMEEGWRLKRKRGGDDKEDDMGVGGECIDGLPDEMIAAVLELPRATRLLCRLVCRRWLPLCGALPFEQERGQLQVECVRQWPLVMLCPLLPKLNGKICTLAASAGRRDALQWA